MDMHDHRHGNALGNESPSRIGRWVFWGFILIAGYFLLTEHLAHVMGALPYLLLAACPLMHLFHHGGHGHGGHQHGEHRTGDQGGEPGDSPASAPQHHPDHS
jgi:hypothetical protein